MLFGSKSVFLGDEVAGVLVDYGAHVAQQRTGGRVDVRGYSSEGLEVITTFLLNSGSNLVAETTHLDMDELDNDAAIAYMRDRIKAFSLDDEFFTGFDLDDGKRQD